MVLAACLGGMLTSQVAAGADPVPQRQDACPDSGTALRYIVLFDRGTAEQAATDEITAACGALSVYYPQIAVAVATSDAPRFVQRIGRSRAFSAQAESARLDDGSRRKPDETMHADSSATTEAVSTVDRTAEQWDMAQIHAPAARAINPGSPDVLVGVLDSGIDPNHPDLRPALDEEHSAGCLTGKPDTTQQAWAPTTSAHGTHVAGTIAAADDGRGITGVAPGVRIASVKVVDDEGDIYPEAVVCGMMWAAQNHMRITNNSYFVDPWLLTCDSSDREHVITESVRRAVDYATWQGVAHVAAATNEAMDLSDPRTLAGRGNRSAAAGRTLDTTCKVLPAGLRGVTAVSAIGPSGVKASYSAYGLGVVDVTAPGGERLRNAPNPDAGCVLSTVPGGYEHYCGTSMAAPHATGVMALLAAEHPTAPPAWLSTQLTSQARPISCPADYDLNGSGTQDAYCTGYKPYNSFHGHGVVDALAAVTK